VGWLPRQSSRIARLAVVGFDADGKICVGWLPQQDSLELLGLLMDSVNSMDTVAWGGYHDKVPELLGLRL
jgi:hypothetical protein